MRAQPARDDHRLKRTGSELTYMSTVQNPRPVRPRRRPSNVRVLQSPVSPDPTGELPGSRPETEEPLPQATLGHKLIAGLAVFAPFAGFVLAIVLAWQYSLMSPLYLGLMVGGWFLTGLGITIGFHRMLTHRSFDTSDWHRLFWACLGSLAVEGPPLAWCAVHRKHHQYSDHHGDPHSPHLHGAGIVNSVRGFVHAHFGWLFRTSWNDDMVEKYVPDLMNVRGMQAITRYYLWFVVASLLIPGLIAGLVTMTWTGFWLGFLWGGLARVFLTHHVTWSINSICHVFGSRDYHAGDDSRNNLIFGILGHGEGWHNNHHAFPTSARHGLKWWQFDTSWLIIRAMQAVGLVWNVRTPSQRALDSKRRSA